VARTLVSGEALDTAVHVINVSARECIIRCEDELGSASKATIMIDEVKGKPSLSSGTPPVEDRAVRRWSRGRSPVGHQYRSPDRSSIGHRRSSERCAASCELSGSPPASVYRDRSPIGQHRSTMVMNRNDVETASGCVVSDSWMSIREGQSSDESKNSQEGYYGAETGHVECLIEQL